MHFSRQSSGQRHRACVAGSGVSRERDTAPAGAVAQNRTDQSASNSNWLAVAFARGR
jgi:hypothetical protein